MGRVEVNTRKKRLVQRQMYQLVEYTSAMTEYNIFMLGFQREAGLPFAGLQRFFGGDLFGVSVLPKVPPPRCYGHGAAPEGEDKRLVAVRVASPV